MATIVVCATVAELSEILDTVPLEKSVTVINNGGDMEVADVAMDRRFRYMHHSYCADKDVVQWILRILVAAHTLNEKTVKVVDAAQGVFATFDVEALQKLAESDWEEALPERTAHPLDVLAECLTRTPTGSRV